jgi:DNA-binding transcriptional LysR family regulator
MDHFSSFRLFIRLVETKSLTRAAADLEMPRSIASKLLADLEMRLGEKLVKDSRQFRLTAEGNRYYGEVRPLMAELGVAADERSAATVCGIAVNPCG